MSFVTRRLSERVGSGKFTVSEVHRPDKHFFGASIGGERSGTRGPRGYQLYVGMIVAGLFYSASPQAVWTADVPAISSVSQGTDGSNGTTLPALGTDGDDGGNGGAVGGTHSAGNSINTVGDNAPGVSVRSLGGNGGDGGDGIGFTIIGSF